MSDSNLLVSSVAQIREPGDARLIFVSYRVDPDQPIAEALKTLIQTTFDPPPKVFVSGAGGLRPSALTFRAQLDSTAKSAVAFIGIITNASKDRAWIHFEAGAAWGRSRLWRSGSLRQLPIGLLRQPLEYLVSALPNSCERCGI